MSVLRPGNVWRLAAVLAAAAVVGQAASARAEGDWARLLVERRSVYVGQSFTVSVVVASRAVPAEPVFPPSEALRVGPLVGGTFVSDPKSGARTFQYQVLARRAGAHAVGPVSVSVGGRILETAAEAVTVRAPEKTEDARLVMTLSKPSCVVGEPVTLTVQWLLAMSLDTVKAVDLSLPVLQDPRLDVLAPHVAEKGVLADAVGLPVSNTRVLAHYGTGTMDGRTCATLTFEKILVPRRGGPIDLAAATALCTVTDGKPGGGWRQYPSYFDNDFFKPDPTGRGRVVYVTGQGLVLNVAPLPPGRPEHFSGLVGRHAISVTAEPAAVPVGAPVTLTIRITGPRPEAVTLGPLAVQEALARDFSVAEHGGAGSILGGAKVFIRTVRPVGPRVRQVPALELNWYDPQTRQYGVSRSKPIPLAVIGSRVAGAGDVEGGAAAAVRDALAAEREHLAHRFSADEVLAEANGGPMGPGQAVWWAVLLAVPPGVFAARVAWRAGRRRREAAGRAREALAAFHQRMTDVRQASSAAAQRCAEVEAAVRHYLADRVGTTASAMTPRRAAGPLRAAGVSGATLAALEAFFDLCQAHRFAPGAAEAAGGLEACSGQALKGCTPETAEQVVARIEEEIA